MEIKIIAINAFEELINDQQNRKIIEMKYNKNSGTLKDIRDKLKIPMSGIEFKKYYNYGGFRFWNNELPYIERKNGTVEFKPIIDTVLIDEFINTHKIENNTLEIIYGFPQSSGPDPMDWITIWNTFVNIKTVIEAGIGTFKFISFIKRKFENKKTIPHEVEDYLYKRDYWNHYELAKKLEVEPEESKNLLKAFGYTWDNSEKVYKISDKKKEQINRAISNIKYLQK